MKTSKPRQLSRRLVLKSLGLLGSLFAVRQVAAHHTETHFEDAAKHRIIYQCNKSDPEYLQHILFSVGELLRKYGDDVEIVVGVFGPGLHLVGKVPGRPVPDNLQASAASLAGTGDGVYCGRTRVFSPTAKNSGGPDIVVIFQVSP